MNELEEKIKIAVKFLGLDDDFTLEEVKKVKRNLNRENHPDNHGDNLKEKKEYEERVKIINGHCSNLIEYVKLHKMEIDEKFKNEVWEFKSKLKSDKLKYNQEKITELVNKYMILLNNVDGFTELKKLKKEYKIKLIELLNNIKKSEEFNLENRKKSLARAFKYKYEKSLNNNDSLDISIKKTRTFLTILELINQSKKDNLDSLISKIGCIEFNDYEHDLDIIKNVLNEFTLYINIETGSYAFVDRFDKDNVYYRKQLYDNLVKGDTKTFLHLHISLEEFLRNAFYVGDRDVALYRLMAHGKEFVRGDILQSRYLYYEHDSGLMLVYKEIEPFENFSFCPTKFNNINKNIEYHFEIATHPKKIDVENGKYRDKKLVYDTLITQIKNNESRKSQSEDIKPGIRR